MDNKVVSVKGKLSPEYKTILKNLHDLGKVLDLPVNKTDASTKLKEYGLISPSGNIPGNEMIESVLSNVEFNAMDFYKFLAVLQTLSRTEKIFVKVHQELYGRLIIRLCEHEQLVEVNNIIINITDQIQHWISSDGYQISSIKGEWMHAPYYKAIN